MSGHPVGPEVAVLAVNWNGRQDCAGMLDSVSAQTLAPAEVVVVDNGSQDGSAEWFADQPQVKLLRNRTNLGFAAAANQALGASRSAYVLLCNLDVRLDPPFLAAAVARLEAAPEIGSVGGRLRRESVSGQAGLLDSTGHVLHRSGWVSNRDQGAPDDARHRQPEEVFGVSAAAALYRRRMLEDIALQGEVFCAALFAYLEDVDLDWRARWRGWSAWYEPAATAVHRRGGSGLHATSGIERHVVANRASVWVRNAPAPWLRDGHLASASWLFALRALAAAGHHPGASLGAIDAVLRLPRSWRERRLIQAGRRTEPEALSRWAEPTPWARLIRGGWERGRLR